MDSLLLLGSLAMLSPDGAGQTGHTLTGAGAVNASLGGAGVALPREPSAALYWNPASLVMFERSQFGFSLELFHPTVELASSVDAGAFGGGFPAARMAGSSGSSADISPIPTFGAVFVDPDSSWVFGLGLSGIGGFGTDYDHTAGNPVLTPQPPAGVGFGAISSEFQLLQLIPTAAYRIDEHWSVGMAPTINRASLRVSPFSAASPGDGNGDGFASYPTVEDADEVWGWGYQLGVLWQGDEGWTLGASYKSEQHFGEEARSRPTASCSDSHSASDLSEGTP